MLVRACIARLPRSNDGASETGSSRPLLFWARVVENDTQKDKEGHRGGRVSARDTALVAFGDSVCGSTESCLCVWTLWWSDQHSEKPEGALLSFGVHSFQSCQCWLYGGRDAGRVLTAWYTPGDIQLSIVSRSRSASFVTESNLDKRQKDASPENHPYLLILNRCRPMMINVPM